MFQYAQKALQLGAYDFLLKPIQKSEFITAIERALGYKLYKDMITSQVFEIITLQFHKRLQLKDIAAQLGYDPSYLARRFKNITGTPVIQTLMEIRMTKSAELLTQGDLTVAQVPEMCGYQSMAGFHRDFKKYFNKTPSEFRL